MRPANSATPERQVHGRGSGESWQRGVEEGAQLATARHQRQLGGADGHHRDKGAVQPLELGIG